jgi:hypothetical protein
MITLEFLHRLQTFMIITMFSLGCTSFVIGAIILVITAAGKDSNSVLAQTNRLAQKGLAEEIAGLVGNATNLLNSINEMVTTRNGIGIALMIFGSILMLVAFYLTTLA